MYRSLVCRGLRNPRKAGPQAHKRYSPATGLRCYLEGGPLSERLVLTVILLSFASAAFAGCLGGDDVSPDDDGLSEPAVAVVSDTTGSIKGTVGSTLFEPLVGSQVGLVETAQETRVNTGGEFVFNEVEPGRYTVIVNVLGYEGGQRAVEVKAGEVTEVKFLLAPLPSDDPYVETQGPYAGKITYAYSYQLEGPVGCQIIVTPVRTIKNCSGSRGGGSINGEIAVNVTDDVKTIVTEMVWRPAGPLGEYLSLDLMCPDVPRDPSTGAVQDTEHDCYWAQDRTRSPITYRVDEEHWLENEYTYTGDWAARVFSTYGMLGTYDATKIDAGVAYEQAFTIYVSVAHKEPAPEGFSGIPDA